MAPKPKSTPTPKAKPTPKPKTKTKLQTKAVGRPALYAKWITPDGLKRIEGWAGEGLYDRQIANDCIHIHVATWCEWKNRFPELSEALEKGRERIDNLIENSVVRMAMGFEVMERKVERSTMPDGGLIVKETTTTKYIPPSIGAACFWLQNRRGDRWKDTRRIDVNNVVEGGSDGKDRLIIMYDYKKPEPIPPEVIAVEGGV